MAHRRKYTEPTQNRTTTFYKAHLDTLEAHADHRTTVTDMIQDAIAEYIAARGWTNPQPETQPPG